MQQRRRNQIIVIICGPFAYCYGKAFFLKKIEILRDDGDARG